MKRDTAAQLDRNHQADAGRAATPTSESTIALSVRDVVKVFPGTRALDGVGLNVRSGEIHALCGGNGSGKSTLIKILCGVLSADAGTVTFGDQELDATHLSPDVSHGLGLRVVHQDLAIFPDLSVAENMMLGSTFPTSTGRVRWSEVKRRAEKLIERFEINAKPSTLMGDLSVAARTQVVIARALQDVEAGEGLIILDEPTASLPLREIELLHNAIRRLAAEGHAILFVSHRLGEVMELSDRVTVFRDGNVVGTHQTSELNEGDLIEAILGKRIAEAANERPVVTNELKGPLFTVSNLSAGPVVDVDLEIRPGEVVGVAGLLGSGRSELLRAIYGDLARTGGDVRLNGKPANFTRPERAIRNGVVLVPEDRLASAAFSDMTLDENLNLSVLHRHWRGVGFRRRTMRSESATLRERFRIKAPSGEVLLSSLSGGNQQKAILARWLRLEPTILLLDEPTQGVDVGARADIYAAVREVTDRGGAALVVTSDIDELVQVVDRAVILRHGSIAAHVPREELNAWRLNELLSSAKDDNS